MVQINGLSGLCMVGFAVLGLISGFVLSPMWLIMKLWNACSSQMGVPEINFFQAGLLWFAVCLAVYMSFKGSISVKVHKAEPVPARELRKAITEMAEKEAVEKEEIKK